MFKRLIIAIGLLLVIPHAAFATTYTPCLRLALPVPGDPSVANVWGTILNTDFSLIDTASGGAGTISVAGSSNVVLTANSGASDQSRNANFVLSGALTGNIYVLFPQSGCGSFSVQNSTTGAFTLGIGVNNGSGSPVGSTITVPQGGTLELVSDGTNVRQRVDIIGLGAGMLASSPGNTMLGNWTGSISAATANAMPSCADAGGNHLNYVSGTGVTCGISGPGTNPAYWRMTLIGSTQSITGGAPQAIIGFNLKSSGSASYCSISTGVCTPNVAGTYAVSCMALVNPGSMGQNQELAEVDIYVNSTAQAANSVYNQVGGSSVQASPNATANVAVNGSTDTISCRAFSTANATIINDVGTVFSGQYIAP